MGHKTLGYGSIILSLIFILLVNQFENLGYTFLFSSFFFLFASVYFFSFVFSENRLLVSIVFSIISALFLFIVSKSYAVSGIYYISNLTGLLIGGALFFFIISIFISQIVFRIDTERNAKDKGSILIEPVLISLIYIILTSLLTMVGSFLYSYVKFLTSQWNNIGTPTTLALRQAASDFPVMIFAFIPLFIAVILACIFYSANKKIENKGLTKSISIIIYLILTALTIILIVYGLFYYFTNLSANVENYNSTSGISLGFDASLISLVLWVSSIFLLFYKIIKE